MSSSLQYQNLLNLNHLSTMNICAFPLQHSIPKQVLRKIINHAISPDTPTRKPYPKPNDLFLRRKNKYNIRNAINRRLSLVQLRLQAWNENCYDGKRCWWCADGRENKRLGRRRYADVHNLRSNIVDLLLTKVNLSKF